jgi:hypothetical protein
MQVLTRGPVHEAFAGAVTFDPEAGLLVRERPPQAIEELPPDQRLEGDNVTWIPGYWAWDDERTDFLWVSGIWRNLPPGRQWVPGYWGLSGPDFQWISGYWADAQVSEIEYLPEPPATVEAGPNSDAPSADQTWLPGSWVWNENRYAWRPGFWSAVQPNWVWTPAHYVYTPRGYVFIDGYWDYPVARRGVLFAPVYFSSGTYAQRGFSYSPRTVINLGAFVDNLFMRPRYQHYYFGDYYAANYHDAGFFPSYSVNSGRYGYDPIFAHERWRNRQDSAWEQQVATTYRHRRDHAEARPPRIWTSPGASGVGDVVSAVRNLVGVSLDQASRSQDSAWRFQAIDQTERERLGQHGREIQRFRDQRQQLETQAAAAATDPVRRSEPTRVRLPTSPIAAKPTVRPDRDYTPPKTHAAPPLDMFVRPQPRTDRSTDQPPRHTTLRPPLDTPKPQPQPKVERPETPRGQPQPQPKMERPETPRSQPQPQPKVERPETPRGQPQPQPKVERPETPRGQSQPQPKVERPETPRGQPQPQPKMERPETPRSQPQPQPKVERPETPRGQPQPQPKMERPETPRGQPQPQPKMERPEMPRGQSQPQPKVERPETRSRDRKPAGPPASGAKPDEDKSPGKGKGKGKS